MIAVDTDQLKPNRANQIFAILILLFAPMGICEAVSSDVIGYPRTIIDDAGREVVISMPVQRVIVQNSDLTESLRILGVDDLIIGVTDAVKARSMYFPELTDREVVGTGMVYDYERIGEMAAGSDGIITPDIVVLGFADPNTPAGSIEKVEEGLFSFKNITVIGLDINKPEKLKVDMTKLGVIFDKEAEAERYLQWYDQRYSAVLDAVKELPSPKVYIEGRGSVMPPDLVTFAPGSALNDVLGLVGGQNIAGDLSQPFPMVEWEWVLENDPDVILIAQRCPTSKLGWEAESGKDLEDLMANRNEVLGRPGQVKAVEDGRVYITDWYMLTGPDDVIGLTYWAKLIHPDVSLDPKEVQREYYSMLDLEFPSDMTSVFPTVEEVNANS